MKGSFTLRQGRGGFEERSPSAAPVLKLSPWILGQAEVQGVKNIVGRSTVGRQGKGDESSGTQLQGELGFGGREACHGGHVLCRRPRRTGCGRQRAKEGPI